MAIGSLGAGIAILAGAGGKGGKKERKKVIDLWNKLETSNFDFTQLTYPERQLVQELMPEVYDAFRPDKAETVAEDAAIRGAQVEALGQVGEIARGGYPLADRIAAERAQNAILQASRGRDLATIRSLATRGNLGGGDEGQLRLASNVAGANLARDLGMGLQESLLNRRLSAIGEYGGQAGALRGADFRSAAFNADAINRFNLDVADIENAARRFNAQAQAEANRYNVGTRQRLADETALGRLGLQQSQQEREDNLLRSLFGQQVTKLGGQTSAYENMALAKDREKAAREAAIAGIGKGVDQLITTAYGAQSPGGGAGISGAGITPVTSAEDPYGFRRYSRLRYYGD